MITNILIGLLMVGITVIVQAIGTSFWIRFLIHEIYEQERKVYKTRFAGLLIITSIFLTILNTVEAFIWALLYYYLPNITEIETLESAIYFSLVTFTTLGYGDLTIGTDYRFLTGIEALNGILLIGWSSAVMFATVHAIWKQNWGIMNKKNSRSNGK